MCTSGKGRKAKAALGRCGSALQRRLPKQSCPLLCLGYSRGRVSCTSPMCCITVESFALSCAGLRGFPSCQSHTAALMAHAVPGEDGVPSPAVPMEPPHVPPAPAVTRPHSGVPTRFGALTCLGGTLGSQGSVQAYSVSTSCTGRCRRFQ